MNNLIDVRCVDNDSLDCDPDALVQADRVHTSLYTDAKLFDAEMEKIFYSTWFGSPTKAKSPTPVATRAPTSASSR